MKSFKSRQNYKPFRPTQHHIQFKLPIYLQIFCRVKYLFLQHHFSQNMKTSIRFS